VRLLMTDLDLGVNGFILFVVILFTVVGLFMDATPAICIFVPMVVPTGLAMGMSPIHLGLIICMVLAFGLITPPYGLCLLLACQIGKVAPQKVFRDLFFMLIAFYITLLLVICTPQFILWLPKFVAPQYM